MKSAESWTTLLARALAHRARLIALEAEHAGEELLLWVLLGAGVVVALLGALIGVHLVLLVSVWESEHRTLYLGLSALVEIAIGLALGKHLHARVRRWVPFQVSREEWDKDVVWIQQLLNHPRKH